MSADTAVPVPLYVSMAAIVAAYRAGALMRAPGVVSAQWEALQQHIEGADTMLRTELARENVAPLVQRLITATPKLPPGDPAIAAISLAAAISWIREARQKFDSIELPADVRMAALSLRFGHDELMRFTARMDKTLREHVCAVFESLANYRGTDSLLTEPVAPADGAA